MRKDRLIIALMLVLISAFAYADDPKSVEVSWDLSGTSEDFEGKTEFGFYADSVSEDELPAYSITNVDYTNGMVGKGQFVFKWDIYASKNVDIGFYTTKLQDKGTPGGANDLDWEISTAYSGQAPAGLTIGSEKIGTTSSTEPGNYGSIESPVKIVSYDPGAEGAKLSNSGYVTIDLVTADASQNEAAVFEATVYAKVITDS